MTDRDFVTTAETLAIDRDVRSSIEAAVAAVDQPRRRTGEVRRELRALRPDDEPSIIDRQFAYGFVRVDTDVVFREVDSKGRLHLVVAVAGDEIDEVMFWEIDGTLVEFSSQADFNSGIVDLGRFKNVARLRERLGVPGQQAIPDLVNETSVTSSFVGTGIAYLYGRFNAKPGIFSGDPTIRAIVRGRKAIDPRDGVQKWTINPIVHAYDLLVKSKRLGGAERSADEINLTAWQTGADFGEELVATKEFTRTTRAGQFANNQLLFPDFPVLDFQFGDVVQGLCQRWRDPAGGPVGRCRLSLHSQAAPHRRCRRDRFPEPEAGDHLRKRHARGRDPVRPGDLRLSGQEGEGNPLFLRFQLSRALYPHRA